MKVPNIGALSIYLATVREFPEGVGLKFEGNDEAAPRLGQITYGAINRFDVGGCSHKASSEFLGRLREYCTVSSFRVP